MRRHTAVLLLFLAPTAVAMAESPASGWEEYRLGQFTATRGRTPQDILAMDNNGEIVLACREGCTHESLIAAGVAVTESQLALLTAWSILSAVDGALRPTFPILDDSSLAVLERAVTDSIEALAGEIEPQVRELVSLLEADGHGERAYALLFSYVLDGKVWNYLDELELIPQRNLDRGGGQWGGEIWAYMPQRKLEPRTSSMSRGDISIRVTWLPENGPFLEPLLRGESGLRRIFRTDFDAESAQDPDFTRTLESYGVLGADRALTLATIDETPGEPLYRLCNQLTTSVAQAVEQRLDRASLLRELGLETEAQATLIGYHALMWGLMERLVELGAVELPRPLADPEAAEPQDAADLLVLVQKPTNQQPADTDDG